MRELRIRHYTCMEANTCRTSISCDSCPLAHNKTCPASQEHGSACLAPIAHKRVRAGATLVEIDRVYDTIGIVADGWAYRHTMQPNGERQILNFYVPGDLFDIDTFVLPNVAAIASISALTDLSVCYFSSAELRKFADRNARTRHMIKHAVRHNQSELAKRLTDVARLPAQARIASFISQIHDRLKQRMLADEKRLPLPLRQQDIADALGLTAEHVNRSLTALRQSGLIDVTNGQALILREHPSI